MFRLATRLIPATRTLFQVRKTPKLDAKTDGTAHFIATPDAYLYGGATGGHYPRLRFPHSQIGRLRRFTRDVFRKEAVEECVN